MWGRHPINVRAVDWVSGGTPLADLVRRRCCPMQQQEHDRHEADGEYQEGDDGPLFRFAETPGDDVDCRHLAGKPEYGGEDHRGDDPDNDVGVHHSCSPTLGRRRAGKARPAGLPWAAGSPGIPSFFQGSPGTGSC